MVGQCHSCESICSILIVASVILSFLRVHPLNATRGSTAVGRFKGEVDVLLRIEANDETGNIDQLLANSDVPLSDEDSGMVNGFGESQLKTCVCRRRSRKSSIERPKT